MVEYHPISAQDQFGLHQFGAKVFPGVFLGYALNHGGEFGNFVFPVADGTVKIFEGDLRLRPSTLIRDRSERGEKQEILQGESVEWFSPSHLQEDSTRDDEEAKNDFRTITGDSNLPSSRWNLESNCTWPKKNHFLFH